MFSKVLIFLTFLFASGVSPAVATSHEKPEYRKVQEIWKRLPLRFESNQGQVDPAVSFLHRGLGQVIYFTSSEVVFVPMDSAADQSGAPPVRMEFLNAGPPAQIQGLDRQAGPVHYLKGSDPSGWLSGIPVYSAVAYRRLYPGIDLLFHGRDGALEYDFQIESRADPGQIILRFEGVRKLWMSAAGDLILDGFTTRLVQRRPLAFQEVDGDRRPVEVGYRILDDRTVAFQLGAYDARFPLLIDPVLGYSTFLGGSGRDSAFDLSADVSGTVYLTGETASLNFPVKNAVQPARGGLTDVFITKIDASGSQVLFSTFLGGTGNDRGLAVTFDAAGEVYLTGSSTSFDFPMVPQNTIQRFKSSGADVFVAKLHRSGSPLLFSTFLGGGADESGRAIALDGKGDIYVTGRTESGDFPTTGASFQPASAGLAEAFVVRIDEEILALIYSTLLGGSGLDEAFDLSVAADGVATIVGSTRSVNFPTASAIQPVLQGFSDAFLARLDPAGATLLFSTFLGGSGVEAGKAVIVDASGNLNVYGETGSSDFPMVSPIQPVLSGESDLFVMRLTPAAHLILFSTYLGGTGQETATGMAVDTAGRVYLAGSTQSADFPLRDPLQTTLQGASDGFISRIDVAAGELAFSTYFGGSASDSIHGLGIDSSGAIYVAGETLSADFPVAGALQSQSGGDVDAFLARLIETRNLYFAQFGDGAEGGASIRSQIILVNLSSELAAHVRIELNGEAGEPMTVDLNGNLVIGATEVTIPPGGVVNLESDGQGPLQTGSVVVSSDVDLSGVIRFEASTGVAGVGASQPLTGLVAAMETGSGFNTGIAVMNLGQAQMLQLELRDAEGLLLARAQIQLPAKGHRALFVTEIDWDTPPDFSNFRGTVIIRSQAAVSATVILVTPGEFATQPVAAKP